MTSRYSIEASWVENDGDFDFLVCDRAFGGVVQREEGIFSWTLKDGRSGPHDSVEIAKQDMLDRLGVQPITTR